MSEEQTDNITVTTPDDIVEPVVETKETQETETDENETDASESEDDEDETKTEDSETSDDDEDEEKDDDEEAKPKKKTNGFKKRLNRAKRQKDEETRLKNEAQRDAEYWKQKALGNKDQAPNTESDDDKEENTGKPSPDNYETQEEYLEALTDYKVDKRLNSQKKEQAQTQEEQRQVNVAKNFQANISEFVKTTPDFKEVMEDAEKVLFKDDIVETILTSDDGPAILYELAQNPDEAVRISKLSVLAGVKEIGKLEAKLSKPSSTKSKTKTNKTTKAPPPIGKKVGGGGKRSGSGDLYDPDISQKDYEAMRNKQLGR